MDIRTRVRGVRRELAARAQVRWRASQPVLDAPATAASRRRALGRRAHVAAVTPEQSLLWTERQRLRRVFESKVYREARIAAERQIGATLDFVDLPGTPPEEKAGRPVARIVTRPAPKLEPRGFATGFLIAPGLLLTNHHVFPGPDDARESAAQFGYEFQRDGQLRKGTTFLFEPERFFVSDRGFDYAVVAVAPTALDGAPLSALGFLPLAGVTGKIRKGDGVSIIQYPAGGPKRYATTNNRLLDLGEDGFMLYETDTAEGSSGSPVFSPAWETVGLHHCGVPMMRDGKLVTRSGALVSPDDEDVEDDELIWIANEGVRVSALIASLQGQRFDDPAKGRILSMLLANTRDPVRLVVEQSPLVGGDTVAPGVAGGAEPAMDSKEVEMADYVFQFNGPVTILIGGGAGGVKVESGGAVGTPTPEPAAPEKSLVFDEDYGSREKLGYRADFLTGWRIPAPRIGPKHHGKPLLKGGKPWVIPYYHYSLVMNADRRLLSWAASNVDYSLAARRFEKPRKAYGGENWRLDPRVATAAGKLQVTDSDFYRPATSIDRGHIVRREDAAWGKNEKEDVFSNSDTYHWTNCTPQSLAFNKASEHGIWGEFEEYLEKQTAAVGGKVSVFAGPVLSPKDPRPKEAKLSALQVPMDFWKIVMCVATESGKRVRRAYAFVFDQSKAIAEHGYVEAMDLGKYSAEQVTVAEIEKRTGLVFDRSVHAADVKKAKGGKAPERVGGARHVITSKADIQIR